MEAIKIVDLCKNYNEIKAVDNLNLEIHEGELFGLLGVNGAGKTTTIKMITCLIKPTSGNVFVFDKSVLEESENIKKIINTSFQETAIAENLTVYENLEFIAQLYGIKGDLKEKIEDILKVFKLEEIKKRKSLNLSGGYKRRLSIAMALVSNPKILLLDEPTLGLDVIARRELWTLIKSLKSKTTIILTTHYLEEAEALCDRIGIMAKGKLKKVGTKDEIIKEKNYKNFEEAFVDIATERED